jgi:positive regulator of sigma E activity
MLLTLGACNSRAGTAAKVERDISRKMDWTWRADCMASLVAGSNSDGFFPVGIPEGASLRSPSQDYRRSRGKTSNRCDNGRCQHV